jgi:DMSO/TMAO reductase YedYZ molybdopterin-dependent catalytic subunit
MSHLTRRDAIAIPFAAWMAEAAEPGETPIPFADTAKFDPAKPRLPWDRHGSWITPNEEFFWVGHYGYPDVDAASWKLEIGGLVDRPRAFPLDEIKRRKQREIPATLECSGNPPVGGLVGNGKWRGTPLAPLLKECGVKAEAIEAVFFAADTGTEKIRGGEYKQNFARSLPVKEALRDDVLVCWEMNGKPLEKTHGAPARLIVPGWYGVAWVKWLTRVELHDRAYLSRFQGRDYVTIRGEQKGENVIWRETSVGRMNLKSVPARAARLADGTVRIYGAAWSDGTPVRSVEVRTDGGEWRAAKIDKNAGGPHCWSFWTYDWKGAAAGEHTISSRAVDAKGKTQPSPDDPSIKLKKTYWEANQQAVRKLTIPA